MLLFVPEYLLVRYPLLRRAPEPRVTLLFLPRSLSFPRHSRTIIELMLDELNALMAAWLSERITISLFRYFLSWSLKNARELANGFGVFRSVHIPYYGIFSQCLNGFSAPIRGQWVPCTMCSPFKSGLIQPEMCSPSSSSKVRISYLNCSKCSVLVLKMVLMSHWTNSHKVYFTSLIFEVFVGAESWKKSLWRVRKLNYFISLH